MISKKNYRLIREFFNEDGQRTKVRKYFILDVRIVGVTSEELIGIGTRRGSLYTETLANMVISMTLNVMPCLNYAVEHLKEPRCCLWPLFLWGVKSSYLQSGRFGHFKSMR